MSNYEAISSVMALGALVAVGISVWMLRGQLRIMTEQNRQLQVDLALSAGASLDSLFVPVTQAFLDHPELRPIFNEGEVLGSKPTADTETLHRASALAELLADAMERALEYADAGLPESAASLRAWTEDSFRHSLFFRTWLDNHRTWYQAPLLAIRDAVAVELPSSA